MKLGVVAHEGVEKVVAVIDEARVLDLRAARIDVTDMVQLIEAGEEGLEAVRIALADPPDLAILDLADISLRCPIRPVQYRDCLAFEAHLKTSLAAAEKMTARAFAIPEMWYERPIYHKGNRLSFVGHGQDVLWPSYADVLDIGLQLAIVVGREGRDIAPAAAPGHIWGYSILNDLSAPETLIAEMAGRLGPAKGKDFDTGNVLGPWIVTADEIAHPAALQMEARVNGERWGGGNSRDMYHDFAAILSCISRSETIHPGEVIGSGTVGTGCGLEIGRRLAPGDVVELEVERIGILRNRIVRQG